MRSARVCCVVCCLAVAGCASRSSAAAELPAPRVAPEDVRIAEWWEHPQPVLSLRPLDCIPPPIGTRDVRRVKR